MKISLDLPFLCLPPLSISFALSLCLSLSISPHSKLLVELLRDDRSASDFFNIINQLYEL
jgi:hypothetical protein